MAVKSNPKWQENLSNKCALNLRVFQLAMEMTLRPAPSTACCLSSRRNRFSAASEALKESSALLRRSLGNRTDRCIAWHRGTRTQSEILPCNSAEYPRPYSQCRCRIIMPCRFCHVLPVRHRQSADYI